MTRIMTPAHPRWDEFCDRLEGPEGCNFVTLDDTIDLTTVPFPSHKYGAIAFHGDLAWWCSGDGENRYQLASAVLWAMKFTMPEIREALRLRNSLQPRQARRLRWRRGPRAAQMTAYLCVWIPISSWLDADGVRHTEPAHLLCSSVPWRRRR